MAKVRRGPDLVQPFNRIASIVGATAFGLFGLAFAAAGVALAVQGFHRDGWGAIAFSSVFVLIGLGLAAAAIAAVPMQRRAAAREAAHPDQPWLWSGDWGTTALVDRAGARVAWLWALAIPINVFLLAAMRGLFLGKMSADPKRWVLLLFVVGGLALLWYAVAVTRRFLRHGRSVFQLDPFPGQIGGRLAGTLHVAGRLGDAGPIRLRLTCHRITSSGEDTTRTLVWEDEREAQPARSSGSGSAVPIEFAVPADQAASRKRWDSSGGIEWRLVASAVKAGPAGYRSQFDVPVFEVALPQPVIPKPTSPREDEPLAHPGITLTRLSGGGCSIHFAAGRDWRSGLFVTALAAVFVAGGLYMPRTGVPIWPRLIVWLFAALLAMGTLRSWFASATVVARSSGLSVDRGLLLLRRRRQVPAGSITDVVLTLSGQAGRSTFYQLDAVTPAGRVRLVGTVRDKRVAEWVSSELLVALGKGRPG